MMNWHIDFFIQPIFHPLTPAAQSFLSYTQWPSLADYNQVLSNKNIISKTAKQLSCISQPKNKSVDFNEQYEPSLYLKGELLTRANNWHDFFNIMVWLTFPKTKAEINFQQYQALQQRLDISKVRTMLENVLTLFDENGAIILSYNQELLQLLKNFQWRELFWQRREEVKKQMCCYIFGHSIYEKALNPYLGMTASSIIFHIDEEVFKLPLVSQLEFLDTKLSEFFKNGAMQTTKELLPLPILGIPGWDKNNEEEIYYHNIQYFRDKKHDKEINKLI